MWELGNSKNTTQKKQGDEYMKRISLPLISLFHFLVTAVNYTQLPDDSGGPYFPFFPDPDSVVCLKEAQCTIPIFAKTNSTGAQITGISVVNASSDFNSHSSVTVGFVTFNNESVYQIDVTLSSSDLGSKQICFQADDSSGFFNNLYTLKLHVSGSVVTRAIEMLADWGA
ncbi:uncharacterized protein LOC106012338 [Aplysia californica]|uniref:Uncharacterized protein LOC106012338 n=1 Tax=Aplysia californica TaxID=6500 RepID=A0ABM1VWK0_APLCA|nr:uncharacterized protein LOC106012338 [Aplysia californica]